MNELFEIVSTVIEAAAVLLLLVGFTLSFGRFLYRTVQGQRLIPYRALRQDLGRTLLLSLELLIAADIVDTIASDHTLPGLGMLGLLVLIRTFLSFALEVELTGRWPWQGREDAAAGN